VIRAALRRLSLLLLGSALGIGLLSALIGLAVGASLGRSVSLGYYLVGSFLLVAGFFIGNRGPLRSRRETGGLLFFGPRVVRRATLDEREEAINTSAVFVLLGFALIILGVAADERYRLL
jgi:ABC-type transport system involved in cytochrome c biogenesis permease subunit